MGPIYAADTKVEMIKLQLEESIQLNRQNEKIVIEIVCQIIVSQKIKNTHETTYCLELQHVVKLQRKNRNEKNLLGEWLPVGVGIDRKMWDQVGGGGEGFYVF